MPTSITVQGTLESVAGVPSTGSVSWKLSQPIYDSSGHLIATTKPIIVVLDVAGHFSVVLWANDDPATNPQGTYYTAVFKVDGQEWTETYILSHTLVSPVDLDALPQAVVVTPATLINAGMLQGRLVSNAAPTNGEALLWDQSADSWGPGPVTDTDEYTMVAGDGATLVFTYAHNLNNLNVEPFCRDVATGQITYPTFTILDANRVQYTFGTPPAVNGKILGVKP